MALTVIRIVNDMKSLGHSLCKYKCGGRRRRQCVGSENGRDFYFDENFMALSSFQLFINH